MRCWILPVLLIIFLLSGCAVFRKDRQDDMAFMPIRKIDPSLRGLTIDESNDPASFSGDWIEDEPRRLI